MKNTIDYKSLVIGIFIPIIVVLFMGYGSNDYISCKGLTITDNKGNPVINLGLNTAGGGFIELGNDRGQQAIIISTTAAGGGVIEAYGSNGYRSNSFQ
tara:strand:- start:317 stop:610 length:294 start_codon:yes stop_codon:yes gene_type:complete